MSANTRFMSFTLGSAHGKCNVWATVSLRHKFIIVLQNIKIQECEFRIKGYSYFIYTCLHANQHQWTHGTFTGIAIRYHTKKPIVFNIIFRYGSLLTICSTLAKLILIVKVLIDINSLNVPYCSFPNAAYFVGFFQYNFTKFPVVGCKHTTCL